MNNRLLLLFVTVIVHIAINKDVVAIHIFKSMSAVTSGLPLMLTLAHKAMSGNDDSLAGQNMQRSAPLPPGATRLAEEKNIGIISPETVSKIPTQIR